MTWAPALVKAVARRPTINQEPRHGLQNGMEGMALVGSSPAEEWSHSEILGAPAAVLGCDAGARLAASMETGHGLEGSKARSGPWTPNGVAVTTAAASRRRVRGDGARLRGASTWPARSVSQRMPRSRARTSLSAGSTKRKGRGRGGGAGRSLTWQGGARCRAPPWAARRRGRGA